MRPPEERGRLASEWARSRPAVAGPLPGVPDGKPVAEEQHTVDRNPGDRRRGWTRWVPAGAVVALVLAVTLVPVHDPSAPGFRACLVCGTHWLADLLSNIPFFAPLGAALAWGGLAFVPAVATGLGLSLAIEGAQLVIPGRFSSMADLLANTLGAGLGHLLFRWVPVLLQVRGRRRQVTASAATVLASLLLLAPAMLHRPTFPDSLFYPQWAPRLEHLEPWRGTLLGVVADELPLPHADTKVTSAVRRKLQQGTVIRIHGTGGPLPSRLSAVFAIHDHAQREVVLVGQRGSDLVWRLRSNASELALRPPSLEWRGGLRGTDGVPFDVTVRTTEDGRACIGVNGEERCGLEPSVGRGWALVIPGDFLPTSWTSTLDLAWLAGLAFVPSVWAGTPGLIPLAVLSGAAALGPVLGPVTPLHAAAWCAILLGGILGILCGRMARRRGSSTLPGP